MPLEQVPDGRPVRIQTRLRFDMPDVPDDVPVTPRPRVQVRLAGDRAAVGTATDTHGAMVWEALVDAGVQVTRDEHGQVFIALADLARLPAHQGRVLWQPDTDLAVVFDLADRPPGGRPATVTVDGEDPTAATLPRPASPTGPAPQRLVITWQAADTSTHQADVDPRVAVALLAAHVPVVASPAAWAAMATLTATPVEVATARINPDRYITLTTSYPQLLEAAPIPSLFRIDTGIYGAPAAHADQIAAIPGIRWDGPRPAPDRPPAHTSSPVPLSAHARRDIDTLLDTIATAGIAAVAWPSGLGRRIFALAAADRLGLWPALIVCHPASLWVWHRHLQLFGNPDATVATYRQLALGTVDVDHAFVICDGLASAATDPAATQAVRTHIGAAETTVVALDTGWPDLTDESLRLLATIKPGEYADLPVPVRYPPDAAARAAAHEALAVLRRTATDPGTEQASQTFASSRTITVQLTDHQRRHIDQVTADVDAGRRSSTEAALEVAQATTCGTDAGVGPKVVRAMQTATAAASAGQSVAVLVAFRQAATYIAQACTGRVEMVTDPQVAPSPVAGQVTVIRFTTSPPDVADYDHVVVVDWPVTVGSLDDAVGPPAGGRAARSVTAIHCAGSIDDRLVELSAGELSIRWPLDDPTARWLLAAAHAADHR